MSYLYIYTPMYVTCLTHMWHAASLFCFCFLYFFLTLGMKTRLCHNRPQELFSEIVRCQQRKKYYMYLWDIGINDTWRVVAHRKGSSPERADILLWLQVANSMQQFGVQVMSVLMTDMTPDETVMRAMNKYVWIFVWLKPLQAQSSWLCIGF